LKKYIKEKRGRKSRFLICKCCGSSKNVMPFFGFCTTCYNNTRPLREDLKNER